MGSDETKKGADAMAYVFQSVPAQRNRIDIDNPAEVMYWSKQFDCSERQLRQAVQEVGDSSAMVEQFLDGQDMLLL